MNHYIFEKPNDTRRKELKTEIHTNLQTIVNDKSQTEMIDVLWWDGTVIDAIHTLYHFEKPFFGVNCWTFGFLANDIHSSKDIPTSFENLEIITEPLLEATVYCTNGEIHTNQYAVNEFALCSMTPWTEPFNTFYLKHWDVTFKPIVWDKLFIAWSIWSTWTWLQYNDGVPLIEHWIKTLWVQWIWTKPFKYHNFEDFNEELIIEFQSRLPWMIEIDCSYKKIYNIQKVVIKYSEQLYSLCFLKKDWHDVFATKRRKLFQKKTNGQSSLLPSRTNE